jgi:protein-disulfide isomerase
MLSGIATLITLALVDRPISPHAIAVASPSPARPKAHVPWVYGPSNARFTITEYADLECPYCRDYFPVLRGWVNAHPDTNWQWQHLPLAIHEPAATRSARIAECAGEAGGNGAFWEALAWLYQNTRGGGAGVPDTATFPLSSPAFTACMKSSRPETVIRAQADAAWRDRVSATPTLRLHDRQTGRTLTLQGLIDGDGLLSAMDHLVAPLSPEAAPVE